MNRKEDVRVGATRAPSTGERTVRRASVLRLEERGRQVTRLLDVLRAIESSRLGITVQDLIEQLDLGCSQRTVYRDLQHLQGAGFALVQDGARYRIEGKTLSSDALRPSQVLALLVATDSMSPLRGSAVESELRALNDSLRARLTPEGRSWVDAVRSTLMTKGSGGVVPLDAAVLESVEEALVVEQLLEIDYAAPNKTTQMRMVEPHLLWCHGTKPYLVAFCRQAQGFRTFALQRIRGARLLDETFDRRTEFQPEEYVREAFGSYRGPTRQLVIRFEQSVAHLANERVWHPSQELERLDNGTVLLSMMVGGLPEIAAWLAGFGGKAQALQPVELRQRVRELHQAGLHAHEEDFWQELTCGDKGGA